MDPITKITSSSYWKNFNSDIQEYIMKQLEYLELKGKGFGINQNIHVYKDVNGKMDQANLICYLFLDSDENTIELRTHNPSAKDKLGNLFTEGEYFRGIGVPQNTEYDLADYSDLLAFDKLIQTISNVQELSILKNMFKRIYENIRDAYLDDEFDSYISDNKDRYSYNEYEENKKTIGESFDRVENYINEKIDSQAYLDDDKDDKQFRILEDIFDILKNVMDINDKYYNIVESLEEDFADINEDNGTDEELETKNALENFITVESEFKQIYMYYKEDFKKELEKESKVKSSNIIKEFLVRLYDFEITLNLGILKIKCRVKNN